MPIYPIENQLTSERREEYFPSHEDLQTFLADNPDWLQAVPSKMNIVGGTRMSHFKTDDEFNSLLKTIANKHPDGSINTK